MHEYTKDNRHVFRPPDCPPPGYAYATNPILSLGEGPSFVMSFLKFVNISLKIYQKWAVSEQAAATIGQTSMPIGTAAYCYISFSFGNKG